MVKRKHLTPAQRAREKKRLKQAELGLEISAGVIGALLLAATGVGAIAEVVAAGGAGGIMGALAAASTGAAAVAGSSAGIAAGAAAGAATAAASSIDIAATPKKQMTKTQMAMDVLGIAAGGLGVIGSLASVGAGAANTARAASGWAITAKVAGYGELASGAGLSAASVAQGEQTDNKGEIAAGAIGIGFAVIGLYASAKSAGLADYRLKNGVSVPERDSSEFDPQGEGFRARKTERLMPYDKEDLNDESFSLDDESNTWSDWRRQFWNARRVRKQFYSRPDYAKTSADLWKTDAESSELSSPDARILVRRLTQARIGVFQNPLNVIEVFIGIQSK